MKIRPSADRQKVIHCPNDVVIVMNEHDIRYFKTLAMWPGIPLFW